MCGFGNRGGVVISDLRRQSGHQHQTFTHQFINPRLVGFEPAYQIIGKGRAGIPDQLHGL